MLVSRDSIGVGCRSVHPLLLLRLVVLMEALGLAVKVARLRLMPLLRLRVCGESPLCVVLLASWVTIAYGGPLWCGFGQLCLWSVEI